LSIPHIPKVLNRFPWTEDWTVERFLISLTSGVSSSLFVLTYGNVTRNDVITTTTTTTTTTVTTTGTTTTTTTTTTACGCRMDGQNPTLCWGVEFSLRRFILSVCVPPDFLPNENLRHFP
jgi:hypothetical protein